MDFSHHQAIYLQIADQVCDSILRGRWAPEERIPSVRDMAIQIEVNPNTVARAYSHLQERGIIFNKRGIGYFIAPDARALVRNDKREAFIHSELPRLFKMMEQLDIDMKSLKVLYASYLTEQGDKDETKQ